MTVIRVPIEIAQTGSGLQATIKGLEEIEKRASTSVQTAPDEPDEPTPGDLLEASHRRLVGRIRERERKEGGWQGE